MNPEQRNRQDQSPDATHLDEASLANSARQHAALLAAAKSLPHADSAPRPSAEVDPRSNPHSSLIEATPRKRGCVFCNIVAETEPANIIYQDDDVIVIQNVLRWVPVMLLAMTRRHTTQSELWDDIGKVGRIAAEIGRQACPGGFRLLSNFGYDAMQSQDHGHLHIIGGTFLGHYVG